MGAELTDNQIRAILSSYRRANSSLEVVQHTRGSVYAEENFFISPEAKGEYSGDWVNRPFQVEILDAMNSPHFYEVSWRKSSRMGASKMLCSTLAQAAGEKKFNTLLYQPNDEKSNAFVKAEIDPMLRDVAVLQPLKLSNSKKYDTLNMKQLRGSIQHYLGGDTANNYRMWSVDLVITDECSAFKRDINGEGDSRALSRTRITESPFGKSINVSSPTFLPDCLITEALGEMDFVFRWRSPCPKCGVTQYLDFFENEAWGLVWDFDMTGKIIDIAKTSRYKCTHCSEESSYADVINAQPGGRWETDDGKYFLHHGMVRDRTGPLLDERWRVGFDSNCLISPAFTWVQFTEEYLKAKRRYDNGSDGPMVTFYNNRLGQPWTRDKAVDTIDHHVLSRRAIRYPSGGVIPKGVVIPVSAADIQGDRIEVGTVGYGVQEESWWLGYEVFPGRTDTSEPWEMLEDFWFERTYETEDGRELPIFLHGIDHGGHQSGTCEKFCRENGIRKFLPLKGRLGQDKPVVEFPRSPHRGSGTWLTMINTDSSKQLLYKRLNYKQDVEEEAEVLAAGMPGAPGIPGIPGEAQGQSTLYSEQVNPGMIWFPKPDQEIYRLFDPKFYQQMTSEHRVLKPSGVPEWITNGPNEVLDIAQMCLALAKIAQMPQYGVNLDADNITRVVKKSTGKYDFRAMGRRLNRRR